VFLAETEGWRWAVVPGLDVPGAAHLDVSPEHEFICRLQDLPLEGRRASESPRRRTNDAYATIPSGTTRETQEQFATDAGFTITWAREGRGATSPCSLEQFRTFKESLWLFRRGVAHHSLGHVDGDLTTDATLRSWIPNE